MKYHLVKESHTRIPHIFPFTFHIHTYTLLTMNWISSQMPCDAKVKIYFELLDNSYCSTTLSAQLCGTISNIRHFFFSVAALHPCVVLGCVMSHSVLILLSFVFYFYFYLSVIIMEPESELESVLFNSYHMHN